MEPVEALKVSNQKKASVVIKGLERRGMSAIYFSTKEEAFAFIKSKLHKSDLISWGGSVTLQEIGLLSYLRDNEYHLIDRNKAADFEELRKMYSEAMLCNVYFMSSNAITMDGELVNIDGNGNRVGALIYGPQNVVIVAGMNKIVPNVEEGISRIKNTAAPLNAWRGDYETGCKYAGHCVNCMTEECMCGQIVVTRYARIPNRIHVVLVGESLGF